MSRSWHHTSNADHTTQLSRHALAIVMTIVWSMACAERTEVTSDPRGAFGTCGDAEISVAKSRFRNAFDIQYTVQFADDEACIPATNYEASLLQARAVELRHAGTSTQATEILHPPLVFERVPSWKEKANALGGPQLLFVATGLPGNYVVPPGEYQLVLKYRRSRCRGKRFEVVCVARSQTFHLEEGITFAEEQ